MSENVKAFGRARRDLMVDLETLDVTGESVVLSIGAASFNPLQAGGGATETWTLTLDVQQQLFWGRSISWSTLSWWMEQSQAARDKAFAPGRVECSEALEALGRFYQQDVGGTGPVWCKGPSFDGTILDTLYRDFGAVDYGGGRDVPWSFRAYRDVRTVTDLAGMSNSGWKPDDWQGEAHDPVADCVFQCLEVQEAVRRLGVR